MPSYNPAVPTGLVNLDVDYKNLQNNFSQLDVTFGVDHTTFSNTTPQNGYHNVIHFLNQVGNPAPIAGTGQLFTKTVSGDNLLFYESALGAVQRLTGPNPPSPAANGYIWIGPVLLQWGTSTKSTDGSVSFSVAFPSSCFGVNCNIFENNNNRHFISVKTKSTTAFTVSSRDSSGNDESNTFFWIALGT